MKSEMQYSRILKKDYAGGQLLLCDHFNVPEPLLYERRQFFQIKYVRWIVWKILHSRGYSLAAIGSIYWQGGNYDHTTVMNALEKLPGDVNTYKDVREAYLLVKEYDLKPLYIDENATLKDFGSNRYSNYYSSKIRNAYANRLQTAQ